MPYLQFGLHITLHEYNSAVLTRTQIVDQFDASFIVMHLDLFPGCRVIESGTGSGCMTLAMARAVQPNGHVYTYEYNEVRSQEAKKDFKI